MKCSKSRRFLGLSAPDPAGGVYDAPSDPLHVRGFLPSAIAASGIWRLQFPRLTCLYAKNSKLFLSPVHPLGPTAPRFLFFSNMSHYLKSFKMCPDSNPEPEGVLMSYTCFKCFPARTCIIRI